MAVAARGCGGALGTLALVPQVVAGGEAIRTPDLTIGGGIVGTRDHRELCGDSGGAQPIETR